MIDLLMKGVTFYNYSCTEVLSLRVLPDRPPLQSGWEALQIVGSSVHMVAIAWGAVLGNMLSVLLGPPASALLGFLRAILELVMPIFQVPSRPLNMQSYC